MATPELEERFLDAGKEFASSLDNLGLDAHALFWAFDKEEGRHVLVLVTDFFDLKGPLEISKQLFKAYNASVTPQEIDPFVVRLHSINQPMGVEYSEHAGMDWTFKIWDKDMNPKPVPPEARISAIDVGGLEMRPGWVIRSRRIPKRKTTEISRRWDRFTRNVQKAAA